MKLQMKTCIAFGLLLVLLLPYLPVFGALSSTVQISAGSDYTTTVGLSTPRDKLNWIVNRAFGNGTDTAQADLVWNDSRTLTTAASETLDLAGTLTDSFGNTVTFAKIKAILVENTSASMTLTLGGAASNACSSFLGDSSDTIVVGPSGLMVLVAPAGYAVTADTGDILKALNSPGDSLVYKIWIIGTSE